MSVISSNASHQYVLIEKSPALKGEIELAGAKNAVLVIMASLILTAGKSKLTNVPVSDDVNNMIQLLTELGAVITFDREKQTLEVDTSNLNRYTVNAELMKKMRASILVMGPLLARFNRAHIALPGGCVLGARPIDFHLKSFARMGADITLAGEFLEAQVPGGLKPVRIILEYPSVGATENIMTAAVLTPGITRIVNAALEPEVFDLIALLTKMGAQISILAPATIEISGVSQLQPVEHAIIPDRLEAGTVLLAAAVTGGSVVMPTAPAWALEVFLEKLNEMGHSIAIGADGIGIKFEATRSPKSVSFRTMPYPGFPTDLQAPMIAAQCLADGTSIVQETVYENRLTHVRELQKMGAQITVEGDKATIKGVDALYGTQVIATDIRASAALIIAGLAAQGHTTMTGINHLLRGYQDLDKKLSRLGASVCIKDQTPAE